MNKRSLFVLATLFPVASILCAVFAPKVLKLNVYSDSERIKGLFIYWVILVGLGLCAYIGGFISRREEEIPVLPMVTASIFLLPGLFLCYIVLFGK